MGLPSLLDLSMGVASRLFDLVVLVPPNPIKNFTYWCGNGFVLDDLELLYKETFYDIGVVITSGEITELHLLDSTTRNQVLVEKLNGRLPSGHNKGGQSAPRFQRMYLSALEAYNKKIVELCLDKYRDQGVSTIKRLIISGNGIRRKQLADELGRYFDTSFDYAYPTIEELVQNIDQKSLSGDAEYRDYLVKLIETRPDLLVFGPEVLELETELEKVFTTNPDLDISREKVICIKRSSKEYAWMHSFGTIGVRYYA